MPYLSQDTTYCYRHCKGISCFPLLLYHPSPRPMPDWITSASLTFICITSLIGLMPRTPYHMHCLTDSLVPCYLYPIPLLRHHDPDSDPDSDLILSMTSSLTDPL